MLVFVATLIGLTVTTGVTNSQEDDSFTSKFITINSAEMSRFQNFESLKVGTQEPPHSRTIAAAHENQLVLGLKANEKTNNQTQTTNKKELARIMRQQFEKFKKSLGQTTKTSESHKEHHHHHHHQSEFLGVPTTTSTVETDSTASEDRLTGDRGDRGLRSRIVIGEVVTKSERRAGEEPSGIKSGFLRIDSHPIPVTFTSLPGFPSISQPSPGGSSSGTSSPGGSRIGASSPERPRPPPSSTTRSGHSSPPSRVSFPRVAIDTAFGGPQGSGIRGAGFDQIQSTPGAAFMTGRRGSSRQRPRTRGQGFLPRGSTGMQGDIRNGIGHLMRILESRLIGGIMGAGSGSRSSSSSSSSSSSTSSNAPTEPFDPSIVINFLTLVALTQQQRRGSFIVGNSESRGPQGQRNASPVSTTSDILEGGGQPTSDSEFGPLSDGNDPSAGVDPSTIQLPPMLRQTLYSYLLPRLSSLSALVETLPGVPGLDYPIISTVPYTNFYCSSMPWPGFYADTEARCQLWHYCDLEGRQASFLCPNGTIFNQAFFVCDWWYNFDCPSAPYLYSMNERVFALPEVDDTAPHRTLTPEILDTIFL